MVLQPWNEETTCEFYNYTHIYESDFCSPFAIARTSRWVLAEATRRAIDCAAKVNTDCVLSPEVGLALPAAFVYDGDAGLRLLLAPQLLPVESPAKRIALLSPETGARSGVEHAFNATVLAQFIDGQTRELVERELAGSEAFCVQLLHASFAKECWEELA